MPTVRPPNNGTHPTRNGAALITSGSGERVMPGVSRFALRGNLLMRAVRPLSFLISLSLLLPLTILAQVMPEDAQRREINNRVLTCEMGLQYQEDIIGAAVESIKSGGVLIVVARLGDGENSRELSRRRLYNVREYLKERGGLAAEKVVTAEGERIRGYGRLEYYLGGKLFEQLLFRRNGYICHSCCGPDESYYPYKEVYDRKPRQRRQRRG